MDRKEYLRDVINSIISGDTEAAKAAFAPYLQSKTREILGYADPQPHGEAPTNEALITKLEEMFAQAEDDVVKFRGDRVIVDGKQVGVIQSDPADFDSGINFIEDGGRFTKEFDTVEALFDFLLQRYSKRGNV